MMHVTIWCELWHHMCVWMSHGTIGRTMVGERFTSQHDKCHNMMSCDITCVFVSVYTLSPHYTSCVILSVYDLSPHYITCVFLSVYDLSPPHALMSQHDELWHHNTCKCLCKEWIVLDGWTTGRTHECFIEKGIRMCCDATTRHDVTRVRVGERDYAHSKTHMWCHNTCECLFRGVLHRVDSCGTRPHTHIRLCK